MTNNEILTKAIKEAIKRGWLPYFATFDSNMTKDSILIRYPEGSSSVNFDYHMKGHIVGVGGYDMEPFSIIYNHEFARALWGYKNTEHQSRFGDTELAYFQVNWEYHLQQMVIAPDAIKYLGNNLPA